MGVLQDIWLTHEDGALDERALGLALELARAGGARLTICHVVEAADEPLDEGDAIARELLGVGEAARCRARITAIAARCAPRLEVQPCIARGRPAEVVLDLVRAARPDLVVVATRRARPRWLRALLGRDVLEALIDRGPCPVLVVRPRPLGSRRPGPR